MKYIDAAKAADKIKEAFNISLCDLLDVFAEIPAEDVQPAPQWISVDERVPDNDAPVLVWYEYWRYDDYNCMWQAYGIAQYIYDRWTGEDLNGSRVKVLAWQPLPEPPKDGDTE